MAKLPRMTVDILNVSKLQQIVESLKSEIADVKKKSTQTIIELRDEYAAYRVETKEQIKELSHRIENLVNYGDQCRKELDRYRNPIQTFKIPAGKECRTCVFRNTEFTNNGDEIFCEFPSFKQMLWDLDEDEKCSECLNYSKTNGLEVLVISKPNDGLVNRSGEE